MSEYELLCEVKNIPSRIRKICAGSRHTIILDDFGNLWFSGRNDMGQNVENLCKFTKLEFNYKIKRVSCGWDVTAAISDENRLFVWGNNMSNQLGFPEKGIIREPKELQLPDNEIPVEVKFGLKFLAILTSSHTLYITGQLKFFLKSQVYPFKIIKHNSIEWFRMDNNDLTEEVIHFACGQNHISFVRRDQLAIHGIGENKFGQCGKVVISKEKIVRIASGWTHLAFLTESKKLFLYGRNNYGQLGNGNRNEIDSATPHQCLICPVDDFALGAEHGILKSNGSVYTWGWNEHRNCGIDIDDDM